MGPMGTKNPFNVKLRPANYCSLKTPPLHIHSSQEISIAALSEANQIRTNDPVSAGSFLQLLKRIFNQSKRLNSIHRSTRVWRKQERTISIQTKS